jgi:hypothetical protein
MLCLTKNLLETFPSRVSQVQFKIMIKQMILVA